VNHNQQGHFFIANEIGMAQLAQGVQDRITARRRMATFRSCKTEIGLLSVFKPKFGLLSAKLSEKTEREIY
jgi:hypothetical protein